METTAYLLLFIVYLSTHADRQGVDILVTVCNLVRLNVYGFLCRQ